MLYLRLGNNIGNSALHHVVFNFIAANLREYLIKKNKNVPMKMIIIATVLSQAVAISIVVGACNVPFTDIEDMLSDGGLGNFTSLSCEFFF
jgi:hypothetical protein